MREMRANHHRFKIFSKYAIKIAGTLNRFKSGPDEVNQALHGSGPYVSVKLISED